MMPVLLLAALGATLLGYAFVGLGENTRYKRIASRHPVLLPLLVGMVFVILLAIVGFLHQTTEQGRTKLDLGFLVGGSLYTLGVLVPVSIVLRRLGHSGWWAVLGFIPIVQIIGLWVIALRRWPSERLPRDDFHA